jgi:hypothetical protein
MSSSSHPSASYIEPLLLFSALAPERLVPATAGTGVDSTPAAAVDLIGVAGITLCFKGVVGMAVDTAPRLAGRAPVRFVAPPVREKGLLGPFDGVCATTPLSRSVAVLLAFAESRMEDEALFFTMLSNNTVFVGPLDGVSVTK